MTGATSCPVEVMEQVISKLNVTQLTVKLIYHCFFLKLLKVFTIKLSFLGGRWSYLTTSITKLRCLWRGAVASWLVRSSTDRVVWVRALAGDIVLCSWARHFTLTVPFSAQVYKWALANSMLGVTLRWTSILSRGGGGVQTLSRSPFMLQKPGKAPA